MTTDNSTLKTDVQVGEAVAGAASVVFPVIAPFVAIAEEMASLILKIKDTVSQAGLSPDDAASYLARIDAAMAAPPKPDGE